MDVDNHSTASSPLQWDGEDLLVQVRLQPRASADAIVGVHAGALKVRVTAPPVEGAANRRAIALLAAAFSVAKSRVTLESGAGSRDKRFRIHQPQRVPAGLLHTDL